MGRTDQPKNNFKRFKENWFHQKKKDYGYEEREEERRNEFKTELAAIEPSKRVYIDESGMDSRSDYRYGWSKRGQKLAALKSGKRRGRVNMIAAYCQKQLFAPFTVEGSCNRIVFETWLEKCLIPRLQPGQVVIMDNATFHQGGRIQELIESVGCRLLYLPPYSPDLNRIEKCWAWLKSRILPLLLYSENLRAAMELVLKDATS